MVHNQWFSARVLIYSVLAAMVLTGCSFFNPYIEPDLPRPGLKRSVEGKPVLDENNHGQPTRVSVGQVREYARSLQDAYRQAAAGQSKTRTVLDLTALSSAAAAIGLAATGGSAEAVGLLGLSAATVFLGGDRLLVATRKKIYFQGALALECVIGATVANPMPSVDADRLGVQLRLLGSERRRLESAINEFKMQVKRVQPTGPEQETATKAIKELRCGKVDKEILS